MAHTVPLLPFIAGVLQRENFHTPKIQSICKYSHSKTPTRNYSQSEGEEEKPTAVPPLPADAFTAPSSPPGHPLAPAWGPRARGWRERRGTRRLRGGRCTSGMRIDRANQRVFFFLNSSLHAQRLLQGKPWLGWSFRRGRAVRGAAAGGRTARPGTQARALLCLAAAAGADLCPVLG